MSIIISRQLNPNKKELKQFFESVFTDIQDNDKFSEDQNQSLIEWFSVDEMVTYLPYGGLFEARNESGQLVGAIFIAKQNPISWPDGHKMEIFILGVTENERGKGIASQLIDEAEKYACEFGARKILVNTHIAMDYVHQFYGKLGYRRMGILQNYYNNGDAVFFQKEISES